MKDISEASEALKKKAEVNSVVQECLNVMNKANYTSTAEGAGEVIKELCVVLGYVPTLSKPSPNFLDIFGPSMLGGSPKAEQKKTETK